MDQQILSLLISDGRMSYTDIGRATGLSTSAVQQRVRKLEARGVITGYTAQVNTDELGLMITAFVRCRPIDATTEDELPTRIAQVPEVISAYSVAGEASLLLKVLVPTPMALAAVLSRLRLTGCSTVTELVMAVPFEDRSPLDAMEAAESSESSPS